MIAITNAQTYGWEAAFRGMRNPLNSWEKSDTDSFHHSGNYWTGNGMSNKIVLGDNDLCLAQSLVKAGNDHSKFLRQLYITADIEAPLYWWKEMDQYKVGTTTNSTSTMHTLSRKPITRDMFSFDSDLDGLEVGLCITRFDIDVSESFQDDVEILIKMCEYYRVKYLETKDKRYWRALIQILPSSWNQLRTWSGNYQVLRNIYHARKNHKLGEWIDFCKWIKSLPYAKELIIGVI